MSDNKEVKSVKALRLSNEDWRLFGAYCAIKSTNRSKLISEYISKCLSEFGQIELLKKMIK